MPLVSRWDLLDAYNMHGRGNARQQFLATAGVETQAVTKGEWAEKGGRRFVENWRLVADCHHALWDYELYWQQQSPLLLFQSRPKFQR